MARGADEQGHGEPLAPSEEHDTMLGAAREQWPQARLLAMLSDEECPAADGLVAALLKPQYIAAEVIDCMDAVVAAEALSPADELLLFRGLFVLGGARYPAACPHLLALLRAEGDDIDDLFGDMVTESLNRILAGVYDGDLASFAAALLDTALGLNVRGAMIEALVILARMKRVDRADVVALLSRLEHVMDPETEEMSWFLWSHAVELLALGELVPAVERAFADGRVSSHMGTVEQFRAGLAAAELAGEDETRFDRERLHYIGDVYEELSPFRSNPTYGDQPNGGDDGIYASPEPVRNPLRHVGRNDPCPCGSGRKYKKCCLDKDVG